MPSTLEQLSPTRAKLTIDMPFAELEPAIAASYKEIANQVNIPGFRKGKVPARLIDQRFGRGTVLQEAINSVLPQAYGEAVQEHDLRPLGQPDIDISELNDGTNVVFTAEVDIRPDFELPDLSEVVIEVPVAQVTDEDVEERLNLLRERFGTLTDVERAAATGDVVTINLTARQDGKVLEDAEASDVPYKLGAGGMLDGLDEALAGMQAGETKKFTSTLVGGPNRGEDAEVEVEVVKVQEQELPDVDNEFAQLVSEFDTAEEMLADLRDNLERMSRIDQANHARELVLQAVLERTEFELPEALVAHEQQTRRDSIEQQLTRSGLTLDQYLAEAEDEEAETVDEFWANVDKRVIEGIRSQIILDKYAEDADLQVSQQELTELIFAKAQQNGSSPEQELQHMMEHDHAAEWMGEVRRGKALGELVAAVKLTDTAGTIIDLSRLQPNGTLAVELDDAEFVDEESAEAPGVPEVTAEEAAPVAEEVKDTKKKVKASAADEQDEESVAQQRTPNSDD